MGEEMYSKKEKEKKDNKVKSKRHKLQPSRKHDHVRTIRLCLLYVVITFKAIYNAGIVI
jgi:hypothetical protein